MRSLSFFQTFTSLAFAMTLFGNSLSLTCHICKERKCTTEKCLSYLTSIGLGSTIACATVFIVDPPGRLCVPEEPWIKLTGGERNGCRDVRGEEYAKVQQEIQNKTNQAFASGIVPQDQIDEMEEQSQEEARQGQASATTIKVCSCNTDLCKFDQEEKKKGSKTDEKGAKDGKSSRNNKASSFLERGTHAMVILLSALAVVVFMRSQ